jgi:hypothetical protein
MDGVEWDLPVRKVLIVGDIRRRPCQIPGEFALVPFERMPEPLFKGEFGSVPKIPNGTIGVCLRVVNIPRPRGAYVAGISTPAIF